MTNFNKSSDIKKINHQLNLANLKKNNLLKNIHKEYDIYLQLVREFLLISVEKGFYELLSVSTKNDVFPNSKIIKNFFDNKLSCLIKSQLPFITLEQLLICYFHNHKNNNITLYRLEDHAHLKNLPNEDYEFFSDTFSGESIQFDINDDNVCKLDYYKPIKNNHLSIDLDNIEQNNNESNFQSAENIVLERKLRTSLFKLSKKDSFDEPSDSGDLNDLEGNIFSQNKNLIKFEFLEKSLANLLLNMSYKVNLELYKAKLIKKIISEESFKFLVSKKFLIKHPHPFLITFDLNIDNVQNNHAKLPNIFLLNITTVELEYKNLIISTQKNKINELKKQFLLLIKKDKYWRKKELYINKMNRNS